MFASSPDEWHHWAFTYETSTGADNGMLTVYQDGSPVFTHSNGRALFPPPPPAARNKMTPRNRAPAGCPHPLCGGRARSCLS